LKFLYTSTTVGLSLLNIVPYRSGKNYQSFGDPNVGKFLRIVRNLYHLGSQ